MMRLDVSVKTKKYYHYYNGHCDIFTHTRKALLVSSTAQINIYAAFCELCQILTYKDDPRTGRIYNDRRSIT